MVKRCTIMRWFEAEIYAVKTKSWKNLFIQTSYSQSRLHNKFTIIKKQHIKQVHKWNEIKCYEKVKKTKLISQQDQHHSQITTTKTTKTTTTTTMTTERRAMAQIKETRTGNQTLDVKWQAQIKTVGWQALKLGMKEGWLVWGGMGPGVPFHRLHPL